MKMVELNKEQKDELKRILDDKYSHGAFVGMITNIYFNHVQTDNPIGADEIINQALLIRLQAKKMAGMNDKTEKKELELAL